MPALAQTFVAVEFFEQRRQVAHDAFQFHFGAMHQLMTALAEPLESVDYALGARHLDHHSETSGGPLRRMAHVFGQEKNLTFLDRNLDRRLAWSFHQPQHYVALQ